MTDLHVVPGQLFQCWGTVGSPRLHGSLLTKKVPWVLYQQCNTGIENTPLPPCPTRNSVLEKIPQAFTNVSCSGNTPRCLIIGCSTTTTIVRNFLVLRKPLLGTQNHACFSSWPQYLDPASQKSDIVSSGSPVRRSPLQRDTNRDLFLVVVQCPSRNVQPQRLLWVLSSSS